MNKRILAVLIVLILLLAAGAAFITGLGPFARPGRPQVTPAGGELVEVALEARPTTTAVPAGPIATLKPAPSVETLATMLQSGDWQTRLAAAGLLVNRHDIPVDRRAGMLAFALADEIGHPSPAGPPEGAYLATTEIVRLQLTRTMGKLDAEAQAALRREAAAATGEARERAVLALGYAGDKSVVGEARRLLISAQNPTVRMDAAHLLGQLRDPAARPELEQALRDPYHVEYKRLSGMAGPIYPVRGQAASALASLGVKVSIVADGVYAVENP